jgi:hypothetical protein
VARRSLKPQLNQIRSWVQQGRTDAWIAHQLDVSVSELVSFKREHELAPPEADGDSGGSPAGNDDEQDLREQDEALIAAALDAEPEEEQEPEEGEGEGDGDGEERPKRRRGRRGGRSRRGRRRLEGTFDHGDEGYGLWLDPGVQDDPIYAEHWAGHRPVTIAVERDQIVIRRAGEDGSSGDEEGSPGDGDAGSSGNGDAGSGGGEPGGGLDPDAFDA